MPIPTISIDGQQADFGNVWVHLQSVEKKLSAPYRIAVPIALVHSIFDPHSTRPNGTGWAEHIQNHVDEFGTFILGGYIKSMLKHSGTAQKGYSWVIATLDEVVANNDFVELCGMAIQFDKDRGIPNLKRLR